MNIEKMPMIPLRGIVVFPGMVTHFDCGRDRTIGAIEESEIRDSKIFLVSQIDEEIEDPTMDEIYTVGAVASIKQILKIPGGIVRILIEGETRGRILSSEEKDKYTEVEVEILETEEIEMNSNIEALTRLAEKDIEEYSEMDQKMLPGMLESLINKDTPATMMDTACCYIELSVENAQKILETEDIEERLEIFHEIFSKEVELLKIEREIDTRVKSQLDKMQKEYYLKEQLEVIKKELGEEKESDEYSKKLEEKNIPEEIRARAKKEIEKLSTISVQSPEYAVILNYLDWIMDLPWTESAEENIDIKNARKILDKEHYGLKKVKERILEFIAVRKLNKNAKGPILCLVGPPGVGKTSIASSIAHALDKNFVRMSLGGVTDEAEIRGHRRTYIGAMPGRVISLMKEAKQKNPVFLMDEIDKVGNNYRGDPASGLLEVLDPVQNKTFTDHYMELPFDLSEVFFVTTANTTSTIPGPLLDRMEIINLEGYTPNEKFNIARRYLVPRQLKESGLSEEDITISDGAIEDIISYYTREAGVRTLEQNISKVIRKAAMMIVEGEKEKISITKRNLNKFLGEKIFLFDLVNKENQVGVVNGLAWTAVGGTTLTIEATVMKGKGNLTLTGSLGNVMKESATAAVSYIAANAEKFGIKEDFRQKNDIHIHVPEGAVPKDGPSAGVTMTTALVSALTKRPVRRDVAMTGEITLQGRVLPIGGLKEKLLAAQRMGVKTVIIPKENIRDLNEIEDNVKNLLEIIPVSDAEKVIEVALEQKWI